MSEQLDREQGDVRATLGRREMLQRSAFVVGATAVWGTPVVQSLGMRAAAAQTEVVADFCPKNQGSITRLILRYSRRGCGYYQAVAYQDDGVTAAASEGCTGTADAGPNTLPETVRVVIRVGSSGNNTVTFDGEVTVNQNIDTGIPQSPQPSTWMEVYDLVSGDLLVSQRFHTSCSEEIYLGDVYGPAIIWDGDWVPN
jgi:hypothetical protein